MPHPLNYPANQQGRRFVVDALTVCSLALFGIALTFTGIATSRMDGARLAWEGGDQYWIQNFPFLKVWTISGLGTAIACVAALRRRIAIPALVLNAVMLSWTLGSYLFNRHNIESRHPNNPSAIPALKW